jgi:hypothetical protein
MIIGGIGLVILGYVAGLVLAGAGTLLAWRMVQYRVRSRRAGGDKCERLESP